MNAFAIDLIERAAATFGETFCGALLLSLAGAPGLPSLSLVEKAAGAAVVATLALLKGLAASFLGDKNSAAALGQAKNTPPFPPGFTPSYPGVPQHAPTPSAETIRTGTADPAP